MGLVSLWYCKALPVDLIFVARKLHIGGKFSSIIYFLNIVLFINFCLLCCWLHEDMKTEGKHNFRHYLSCSRKFQLFCDQ